MDVNATVGPSKPGNGSSRECVLFNGELVRVSLLGLLEFRHSES